MGLFSKIKDSGELVLVFDIGSSSVGGAFFRMQKSGVPKIVKTFREPIILEKSIDADRFLSSTLKSLEIIAKYAYEARMGAPSKVFCTLSSPWHMSQTRVISFGKNTPFIFTPKFADELIQKEIELFKQDHREKYGHGEGDVRLIELKSIKTMLNGYETSKPLDQKAKELEMTVFISLSEEQVLKKIENTISKHFNFENIRFCSFLLSSFVVVRDIYLEQENFLLIDIGGEVTDTAMAKSNTLRESISFPLGRNFIIRGVASTLRSSLDEAKSSIALLKDGHATVAVTKKISPILNKLQMEWLKQFQESLANLSSDISIPSTIFLYVDKDLADFFRQTIEIEQFNQYTLTESKFKVIFLDAEVFQNKVMIEGGVSYDPGLIIDTIYINRL